MTPDQIKEMNRDYRLQSDNPDYAGMYGYVFRTFGTQMPQKQRYWFQQAAQINKYLNDYVANPETVPPSPSAYFIQQINNESLTIAHGSGAATPQKIQAITNKIGENVYTDIICSNNTIPDMQSQVDNDIQAAIQEGRLDV